jgi:hypothetical protein
MKREVALRLEGGVGDHLLGLRIVSHVRLKYPDHSICVYSDCGGFRSQLQICMMSPHIERIVPVYQDRSIVNIKNAGSLDNLIPQYLDQMKAADVFFDVWPGPIYKPESDLIDCGEMFIPHAEVLGVSNLTILSSRPKLIIPEEDIYRAKEYLNEIGEYRFVALNLEKFGRPYAEFCFDFLRDGMLRFLADNPKVCILNIYSTNIQFPHYPDGADLGRRRLSEEASSFLATLGDFHPRIISIQDMSIIRISALLLQCDYLIGMDNGIKHLAWALGVPLKFLVIKRPSRDAILRWMPDPENLCIIAERQCGARVMFDDITAILRERTPPDR